MNLRDVKLVYAFSCVILGSIILLPTLAIFVPFTGDEQFSELWLLGPNRMAEGYPFTVSAGTSYKVYLGIGNQMGNLNYYRVVVKIRNESEQLPNSTAGTPNPIEPIIKYNAVLRNNETWEKEVTFAFDGVTFEGDICRVSSVHIDDYTMAIDKTAIWNATSNTFYFQLFFELWRYDAASSSFQFHNRCVGLRLNMSR